MSVSLIGLCLKNSHKSNKKTISRGICSPICLLNAFFFRQNSADPPRRPKSLGDRRWQKFKRSWSIRCSWCTLHSLIALRCRYPFAQPQPLLILRRPLMQFSRFPDGYFRIRTLANNWRALRHFTSLFAAPRALHKRRTATALSGCRR